VGHLVGLVLVIALSASAGTLPARVVLLPVIALLTVTGLFGVAWIVAPLGLLLPDATYLVNIVTTMFMFVTPIAFTPEMVPPRFQPVVWLNPLTYVIQAYRSVLMDRAPFDADAAGDLFGRSRRPVLRGRGVVPAIKMSSSISSNTVIRAADLTKVYRLYARRADRPLDVLGLLRDGAGRRYTEHTAVDRPTLDVQRGERVAIIGRNGSARAHC
jgi:hypothetical protein